MAGGAVLFARTMVGSQSCPGLAVRVRDGAWIGEAEAEGPAQQEQQRGRGEARNPPGEKSAAIAPATLRGARWRGVAANTGGQGTFGARSAVFRRARAAVMPFFLAGLQVERGSALSSGSATAALVGTEAAGHAAFAAATDPFLVGPFIRVWPFVILLTHGAPMENPKTRTR